MIRRKNTTFIPAFCGGLFFWTLMSVFGVHLAVAEHAEMYKPYARTLTNYVLDDGRVDYASLKRNRKELDSFIRSLKSLSDTDYAALSENQKIALWINAYNAITLQAIIDNYPIQSSFITSLVYPSNSIRQIENVWDKQDYEVARRRVSLNDIEHKILRQEFSQPEIHVALVCAAKSCPPLRNEPYYANLLEEQFKSQGEAFVESGRGIEIDTDAKTVRVSAIFDWFGEDFATKYSGNKNLKGYSAKQQSILGYLVNFISEDSKEYLYQKKPNLSYLDYDWSLNDL